METVEIKNQINKPRKRSSAKQKIANALNPLKHGKTSKYFNTDIVRFIKDPKLLADLMMDSIKKLEQDDLDTKERMLYTNTLTNVYKTIFGNKNLNINLDISKDSAKSMNEIYLEVIGNETKANTQSIGEGTINKGS